MIHWEIMWRIKGYKQLLVCLMSSVYCSNNIYDPPTILRPYISSSSLKYVPNSFLIRQYNLIIFISKNPFLCTYLLSTVIMGLQTSRLFFVHALSLCALDGTQCLLLNEFVLSKREIIVASETIAELLVTSNLNY